MIDVGHGITFVGSGTPASPNTVRLGGRVSGNFVTVTVLLGGPTTSTDIYGFAFDLVMDSSDVVELTPLSAGPALRQLSGCESIEFLSRQSGNRIVVGITKVGWCDGNGIDAGEEVIATYSYRAFVPGRTTLRFDGPPGGSGPSAYDSNGNVIDTIVFDTGTATIVTE